MSRALLGGCVCGRCEWCPDGYHGDTQACGCTPDCILGSTCETCGRVHGDDCQCDL